VLILLVKIAGGASDDDVLGAVGTALGEGRHMINVVFV